MKRSVEYVDSSFRVCLCTLLLLLALFGITTVFLWRFGEKRLESCQPSSDASSSVENGMIKYDKQNTISLIHGETTSQRPNTTTTTTSIHSKQHGNPSTTRNVSALKNLETSKFTTVETETSPINKSTTEDEGSTFNILLIATGETEFPEYITNSKKHSDEKLETLNNFPSTITLQDSMNIRTESNYILIMEEKESKHDSYATESEESTSYVMTRASKDDTESSSGKSTVIEYSENRTETNTFNEKVETPGYTTVSAELHPYRGTKPNKYINELADPSTLNILGQIVEGEEATKTSMYAEEFKKTSQISKAQIEIIPDTDKLTTIKDEIEVMIRNSAIDTTEMESSTFNNIINRSTTSTAAPSTVAVSSAVTTPSTVTVPSTATAPSTATTPHPACLNLTCPILSCPDCPSVTCPTIPVSSAPTTTVKPDVPVCKTSQCYATAARILSLVNATVDPCENFYSYACGGIFNNPLLLENDLESDVWKRMERAVKNISSTSPESHQKLKNFFDGCFNYDKMVSVEERKLQGRKVLDSVAKFADSSSTPENDFTDLLIKLFQHGSRLLFDLRLDVDSSNSSKFQLVVTVPDWLHSHFYDRTKRCKPSSVPTDLSSAYNDYEKCMGNFSEFIDTTQKALEFFGVFEYLPEYNASQLIQEIRMSMELDILELLRIYPSPVSVNKDTESKTYKLILKTQLERDLPMISWSYLFSSLLNMEVPDSTYLQVYFMDNLKQFFDNLQTKSTRTVYNSLLAMFAHDLYLDLALTHEACDRERYCLRVTSELLPVISSNLYMESFPAYIEGELKTQVLKTYKELESAMEDKISKATWLDDKTSNEIFKKLKFMSIQLPIKFNDTILNSSLGECSLKRKQYLEDSVCLLKQQQKLLYSRYTSDPHSAYAMWPFFLTAFSTHTAFIYGLNTFMIPLAVIQPVYNPQMPRHVVMATLGNILARGIGHNFDPTGVKFAAGGKIGNMLSEATNPTYNAVVEESNMQFSYGKSHKEDGQIYSYMLDPELTTNERLSDIMAANLSLSTVLGSSDYVLPWTPFSPTQTYFLALAQSFCSKKRMSEMFTSLNEGTFLLPFDRVFNMAANSEQFAVAFRCPLGTTMNGALKTHPFPTFVKAESFSDYALPVY